MKRIAMLIFWSLLVFCQAKAQNPEADSGQARMATVTGTVIDADSKEPLPGAVVEILGTTMGANTDLDGRYIIVNVPAGICSVQAKMKGWKKSKISEIQAKAEFTITVNFKLVPELIDLSETIYLPMSHYDWYDRTSTRLEISEYTIDMLPSRSLPAFLSILPGKEYDLKTEGRNSETAFYINQFEITDRQYGTVPFIISPSSIREYMIRSVGFQAADGQALSEIVRFEPRLSVSNKKAVLSLQSDDLFGNNNDGKDRVVGSIGSRIGHNSGLLYSFQGEVERQDGERTYGFPVRTFVRDQQSDRLWADTLRYSQSTWNDTAAAWGGGWMDSTDACWDRERAERMETGRRRGWREADSYRLPHTDRALVNLSGAMKYRVRGYNVGIDILGFYNKSQRSDYSTTWKYNSDQYYAHADKSWLMGVKFRHSPDRNMFYVLAMNKYLVSKQTGVRDTAAERGRDWWEDYDFVPGTDADGDSIYDGYEGNMYDLSSVDNPYGVPGIFASRGMPRVWRKSQYSYTGYSGNMVWQADRYHMLNIGIDIKKHQVFLKENTLPWNPEPFKDYYQYSPVTAGAYAQDRLEFEGFIVQAGLRWDYLDPSVFLKYDIFDLSDNPTKRPSKTQHTMSPRLGISWLVTERTIYRVNIGKYVQQPLFQQMYQCLDADLTRGNSIVGDPDLKFPSATVYEAGFDHQRGNVVISGTVYYKERRDLVGLTYYDDFRTHGTGLNYFQYQNNGQSSTRGFELSVNKHPSGRSGFSWEASYTYQATRYCEKPVLESFGTWYYTLGSNPYTGIPLEFYQEDHPPDWDLSHKFVFLTYLDLDGSYGPTLAGIKPFSNISVGLVNVVKSGLPYTKMYKEGMPVNGLNQNRLSWTWNTDLKVEKRFKLWKSEGSLALEVLNLFDRRNVSGVYPQSGQPDWMNPPLDQQAFADSSIVDSLPGPVSGQGDTVFIPNPDYNQRRDLNGDGVIDSDEMYSTYKAAWEDFITDPRNPLRTPDPSAYQPPRSIRLALGVKF